MLNSKELFQRPNIDKFDHFYFIPINISRRGSKNNIVFDNIKPVVLENEGFKRRAAGQSFASMI